MFFASRVKRVPFDQIIFFRKKVAERKKNKCGPFGLIGIKPRSELSG